MQPQIQSPSRDIPRRRITPESPCPCGSQGPVRKCCADTDGQIRVKVPSLLPPGRATGYAHSKCYLSEARNCSSKISGEHFVSRAILESLGEEVQVGGIPWQARGTILKCGIDSLVSNILCTRHNSALSPLDALAARAFGVIRDVCDDLNHASDVTTTEWHLVSGEALELWCLKTLCGLFFSSVAAKDGTSLKRTHTIDVHAFEEALRLRRLPSNCGLYARLVTGEFKGPITWNPLTSNDASKVIGLRVRMHAVQFEVILDPSNVNFDVVHKENIFRPWNLVFGDGKRTHVVVMSWPDKPQGDRRRINYTMRPTLPSL